MSPVRQYLVSHLNTSRVDFRQSISVTISALGEACVSLLQFLATQHELPNIGAGIWDTNYLKIDGKVEREMLKKGWCKSDIERIRQSFSGLATRHFLSNMEKPKGNSHDSCSLQMCANRW